MSTSARSGLQLRSFSERYNHELPKTATANTELCVSLTDSDTDECVEIFKAGAGYQEGTNRSLAGNNYATTKMRNSAQQPLMSNNSHRSEEESCIRKREQKHDALHKQDTFSMTSETTSSDSSLTLVLPAVELRVEKGLESNTINDMAIAKLLQQQEEDHNQQKPIESPAVKPQEQESTTLDDSAIAKLLQQEEEEKYKPRKPIEEFSDSELAQFRQEQNNMTTSVAGRAVVAVQRIIELVQNVKTNHPRFSAVAQRYVDTVATDDMVYMAEKLLHQQVGFIIQNVPSYVDIGYHYTNSSNMRSIRTNGLLTQGDRTKQRVTTVRFNGSYFGDGVYTANNPKSFSSYGSVGLLVGRLQGHIARVPSGARLHGFYDPIEKRNVADAHTIIGDKTARAGTTWPRKDVYHEIVLKSSSQCLPMVKYDKVMLNNRLGRQCIQYFESSLQTILDELFNEGSRSSLWYHRRGSTTTTTTSKKVDRRGSTTTTSKKIELLRGCLLGNIAAKVPSTLLFRRNQPSNNKKNAPTHTNFGNNMMVHHEYAPQVSAIAKFDGNRLRELSREEQCTSSLATSNSVHSFPTCQMNSTMKKISAAILFVMLVHLRVASLPAFSGNFLNEIDNDCDEPVKSYISEDTYGIAFVTVLFVAFLCYSVNSTKKISAAILFAILLYLRDSLLFLDEIDNDYEPVIKSYISEEARGIAFVTVSFVAFRCYLLRSRRAAYIRSRARPRRIR